MDNAVKKSAEIKLIFEGDAAHGNNSAGPIFVLINYCGCSQPDPS